MLKKLCFWGERGFVSLPWLRRIIFKTSSQTTRNTLSIIWMNLFSTVILKSLFFINIWWHSSVCVEIFLKVESNSSFRLHERDALDRLHITFSSYNFFLFLVIIFFSSYSFFLLLVINILQYCLRLLWSTFIMLSPPRLFVTLSAQNFKHFLGK